MSAYTAQIKRNCDRTELLNDTLHEKLSWFPNFWVCSSPKFSFNSNFFFFFRCAKYRYACLPCTVVDVAMSRLTLHPELVDARVHGG